MKINDNTVIDCLKEVQSNNQSTDNIKTIIYQVAVSLANANKIDNPRFNSGEFLFKFIE